MQNDKSRTPEAKARTKALKARRSEKRIIVNQPFKSEMILNHIAEHKAFYGSN